ncbi:uncharacterized protein LOC132623657 [Lycium barbarum]|uniref:uncharacterized protein LOC132623657 n=1 Tax=Lycium barbarum TaxID=112863 RepID=UPI00293E7497|nr:uncharacterized protein LOC132623657 [Lycium barbarum]
MDETVQDVMELRNQDGWNISKLQQLFPTDIVDQILEELDFHESTEEWDKTKWMMTASGKFTVGNAWELLRRKAGKSDIYKSMWIPGLPFKSSFFFWRLWKCKLPVGDIVRMIRIDTEGKCYCCDPKQCETVDHLFVTGKIASQFWRYVKAVVGITTTLLQVKQVIQVWWNADFLSKFKSIIRAIPVITMWQIWKWRNTVVHGGKMTINKVIYEINLTIYQICRVRKTLFLILQVNIISISTNHFQGKQDRF